MEHMESAYVKAKIIQVNIRNENCPRHCAETMRHGLVIGTPRSEMLAPDRIYYKYRRDIFHGLICTHKPPK